MRTLLSLTTLLAALAFVSVAPTAKADCPHNGTKFDHPHCGGGEQLTRIVFLTSVTFQGDLGNDLGCDNAISLDRADCICNALADAAELGTNFAAWLSTSAGNPAADFFPSPTAYVRVDGVMVASSWADLVDGTILHPIEVDEQGVHPGSELRGQSLDLILANTQRPVWTGTNTDGTFPPLPPPLPQDSQNCQEWTTTESFGRYAMTP